LRQISELDPGFNVRSFDISRDGHEILFDRIRDNADVVVIDLPN
jgi:Flp pilus assembly CpaE family ATPase